MYTYLRMIDFHESAFFHLYLNTSSKLKEKVTAKMFVLFLTLFFTVNGNDNCTSDGHWMTRGVLLREALSDKCDRIVLSEIVEVRLKSVYDIL